jgi:predicted anti-sigma-YlaC factor YlaD
LPSEVSERESVSDKISCTLVVNLITDYLENALHPDDHARVANHLANCDGCGAFLDQFKQIIKLAGSLDADDLSPDAKRALLEAFRDWNR